MDECIPHERANRDFCVKFPEEIRHDNLAGQLWFGAEVSLSCLCYLVLMGNFLWHQAADKGLGLQVPCTELRNASCPGERGGDTELQMEFKK